MPVALYFLASLAGAVPWLLNVSASVTMGGRGRRTRTLSG
jgi:hypothetical protein